MIVLGNQQFVRAMKAAGVPDSFEITTYKQLTQKLDSLPNDSLILINESLLKLSPDLPSTYPNLVTIPDSLEQFEGMSDLAALIRSVVGAEIEI